MTSLSVSTAMQLNPIFKMRFINKSLCDINEIDNSKYDFVKSIPLSAFDLLQYKKEDNNDISNFNDTNKTKDLGSGYGFAKTNFNKLNKDYLTLRKSISDVKSKEIITLRKKYF